ncbi:DUF1508 domain-containing protein [Candidatus Parcubacteria bacterium]|nr:DUF1508 domain-containing protein [Candidatus Parcubacteria bacterium]
MKKVKGELFKDRKGEIRGRVRSNNGNIIATTEGYTRKGSAENALKLLGVNKKDTKDLRKK